MLETHHLSHSTEYILMGVMLVLTAVVIFIAYARYIGKQHVPQKEGTALPSFHQLIYKKYFIDELYDSLIVKPLYSISAGFEKWIERSGIDKLVNAAGSGVDSLAGVLRLLQRGSISFYILIMALSIVLLLISRM
jgi:NADH-quinone oxidoreductase subunit L